MTRYIPTIGLEIHAELKTQTKMFCDSKNDPNETRPNMNVCPICMAHPGTLPTINKEAVKHIITIGKAVGGTIADFTQFDRKNYFYPDIPKGYQISQYKNPIVSGGELAGVALTRVHLEEDTARSTHDASDTHSLVDFNRAGIPLMELVTEPVIGSAQIAGRFARELQLLLRTLGVSEANMEKGEMRVEANISIAPEGERGTKVEVKNINSFRAVEKAIEYEITRQTEALENGEKIIQETRGWNEKKQQTFSQRVKETSEDYRYFPEPDLPPLFLSEVAEFQNIILPELPSRKRERYASVYGIKSEDIESYVEDRALGDFFEDVAKFFQGDKTLMVLASNYITSDLIGLIKNSNLGVTPLSLLRGVTPKYFAELIFMAHRGDISSRGAKDILAIMFINGGDPKKIAEEKRLLQQSDETALKEVAQKIISENQKVADEYKKGKESALQFLIGQGMKETKGSANPGVFKKIFVEFLKFN